MLISAALATAISQQVGNEFGAMMQYLAMASYFDRENLPELAKFFYFQAEEEKSHALKLAHYVTDAGGMLTIPAVPAPKPDFASAEEAVKLALDWEIEVTGQINGLVAIARQANDYLAENFLDWFVNEQLEEVTSMDRLLATVKRASANLLLVEEYLARNPHVAAAGAAAGGE